jgi:hypothetical protein
MRPMYLEILTSQVIEADELKPKILPIRCEFQMALSVLM